MNKQIQVLFFLGLICSIFCITSYTISAIPAEITFDAVLGQSSLTASDGTTLRTPVDVVYSSKGGVYVTDSYSNGGKVLYYSNPSVNQPTFALGAASVNTSIGDLKPTGLALYTSGGSDNYIAISSGGSSYSKFYNLNNQTSQAGVGSDAVTSIAAQVGGPSENLNGVGGSYLPLAIDQTDGRLFIADSGNNRVVVQPNNGSSLPLLIYGAGSNGLASTCNSSQITCFSNPQSVAVDCYSGVWIAVGGVNGTNIGTGVLYFPAGSRVATALYLPNTTTDFNPSLLGISFNSGCTRVAFAGTNRVYIGSLSLPIIPITNPLISSLYSLGVYSTSGTIPNPSASSNSLTLVENASWDPTNANRIAIVDTYHNRVVLGNVANVSATTGNPSIVASASASTSASGLNRTSASSSVPIIPIASTSPSASSNTSRVVLISASPNATSATPSAFNSTSSTFSVIVVVPTSPTASYNATFSASPSASPNYNNANNNSSTPSFSTVASQSTTNTATPLPTYTAEPGNYSSESFSTTPSYYVAPQDLTGAGMRIQSWMKYF